MSENGEKLPDIQMYRDDRKLKINKVGVKGVRYPIIVRDKAAGSQSTVATINMYVELSHDLKGTHMSRFIEILNEYRGEIGINRFRAILERMKEHLNASSAHMEIEFPYFMEKEAPVSREKSLMEYYCRFEGNLSDKHDFIVRVKVPVMTVCPCSKEISVYGAHNQRGIVTVSVRFRKFFWIEDVIRMAETSASGELFSLLKRPDEKYITEKSFDNPRFAEDVVREIATKLKADENFFWFSVEAENFESIHNHSAYAYIEFS
jgi:GTP cyclohydrolase IB